MAIWLHAMAIWLAIDLDHYVVRSPTNLSAGRSQVESAKEIAGIVF